MTDGGCICRETLRDILLNRVGADQFKNRLSRLRDSTAFINVSKILYISTEEDESFNLNGSLPMLVLDYHFVELFKESYGEYCLQKGGRVLCSMMLANAFL